MPVKTNVGISMAINHGIRHVFFKFSDVGNLEQVLQLARRSKYPCAYAVFRFHTTQV